MPFSCHFQLNNGAINKEDEVLFVEFIYSSLDIFHEGPAPIARILLNNKPAEVWSTCPCFFSSYAKLVENQVIETNTIIGYFSANGEDIPYHKPYATIKFIQ
jgi:hypothetical protein